MNSKLPAQRTPISPTLPLKSACTSAAGAGVLSDLMASIEDGKEDEEEIESENEEAEQDTQPLRVARDPKLPSHDDVECHRCSHVPFRDWCRHCVRGRGRGDPHLRTEGSSIPVVGLDYFFIEGDQLEKRKELDYPEDAAGEAALEEARSSGSLIKCLIIRCAASKCLFGHVVPRKGADEEDFVADLVVKAVSWMGHTELIMKGDNEPALQALIARALELIRIKVDIVTNNISRCAWNAHFSKHHHNTPIFAAFRNCCSVP